MQKYALPVVFLLLGVVVGLSINTRTLTNSQPSAGTSISTPEIQRLSLFSGLSASAAEDIFQQKLSLPNTFDQMTTPPKYIAPANFRQPALVMTEEGKEILDSVRTTHIPTELISNARNQEFLCAGYIYELTARLRGPRGPQRVGLLSPDARSACDAREIPGCYSFYGGSILYDVGPKHGAHLKKDANSYTTGVSADEFMKLFSAAFSYDNLLGDIGFLFRNSNYLHMLGVYDSYNTHITKNMGISEFDVTVKYPSEGTGVDNDILFRDALGCSEGMWPLVKPLLPHYDMKINGLPARYLSGQLVLVNTGENTLIPYELRSLDTITYKDVTLAHFYGGENVDSLLQMSCHGEFYPINVLEINPKFIEKY